MKPIAIALLLMCLYLTGTAQRNFTKVDYKEVERLTTTPQLPTYYPELLKRFNTFDATLTNEDYRLLYYGFVFQKGYNAYAHHHETGLRRLLAQKKYTELLKTCDSILAVMPISLVANYMKSAAMYAMNEDDSRSLANRTRYRRLRDAILSTGDGFKCESALATIFVEDENDIMYHYFELPPYDAKKQEGPCNAYDVKQSKYFLGSKIYFNTGDAIAISQQGKKKK